MSDTTAFDDVVDDVPPPLHSVSEDDVLGALRSIVQQLGGSNRDSQEQMATQVAASASAGRHLLVDAPTGTGKSLGYLVPLAMMSNELPVVVATATKALQQQLVDVDLPVLGKQFPGLKWAIMKGRGNWVCKDKVEQVLNPEDGQEALFSAKVDPDALNELMEWAQQTTTGDRKDAPDGVSDAEWSGVSVGPMECTGEECRFYNECFAEEAKAKAQEADIVVTNVHMLLLNSLTFEKLLPTYQHVVVDEAHKLPEIGRNVLGVSLRAGRLGWLARNVEGLIEGDDASIEKMKDAETELTNVLNDLSGVEGAVDPTEGALAAALNQTMNASLQLRAVVKTAPTSSENQTSRMKQLNNALENLEGELVALLNADRYMVTWVEAARGKASPALRMVPVDIAPSLAACLFEGKTVTMASATLAVGGSFDHPMETSGVVGVTDTLKVPSPFNFREQGQLYVPMHAPKPGGKPAQNDLWKASVKEETLALLKASNGRALMLFTSWAHLNEVCDWLDEQDLPWPLFRQGEAPTGRLVERFKADTNSVLAGTASFWEGVDIPGEAASLVIIDRLPFPYYKDPLVQAQKSLAEEQGKNSFLAVDVPHAAVQLAQGAGRLIRRVDDRGVVAVLDSRLANTAFYKDYLLNSLPAFRRVATIDKVRSFLSEEENSSR